MASTAAAALGEGQPARPPITIIAIAAGGGALVVIALVSYFCYRKRKQGRLILAAYENPKRKPYESVVLGSGEKPLSLRTLSPPPPPETRATLSGDVLVISSKPADRKETGQAPPAEAEPPAVVTAAGITVCTPSEKPTGCSEAENQTCTDNGKFVPPPIELHPAFSKTPKALEPRPYDIYSPESPGFLQMIPQQAAGPLEDGGHAAGNGDNGFYPQEPSIPRMETPPPPPLDPPHTPQEYNQDIFQEYLQEFQEDMDGDYIEESPSMWNQQAEFPAPARVQGDELRDSYADTTDIYESYAPPGPSEIHCPSPTYPRNDSLPQKLETPGCSPCTPPPPSPLRGHWSQLPEPRQLTPPQRPRTPAQITAHMTPPPLQPQPRFSVTSTPPPPPSQTPPPPKVASPPRPPRGPDVYVPLEMATHYPQMILPHAL